MSIEKKAETPKERGLEPAFRNVLPYFLAALFFATAAAGLFLDLGVTQDGFVTLPGLSKEKVFTFLLSLLPTGLQAYSYIKIYELKTAGYFKNYFWFAVASGLTSLIEFWLVRAGLISRYLSEGGELSAISQIVILIEAVFIAFLAEVLFVVGLNILSSALSKRKE